FDQTLWLRQAAVTSLTGDRLVVELVWEGETAVVPPLVAFVHLVGPAGIITQSDMPPGQGLWVDNWWQPGLALREQRTLQLPPSFDPSQHQIHVGLYHASTSERLSRLDDTGDVYLIPLLTESTPR
ncbi:MAG: hypothetical protein R6X32_19960, partial [Chloroflexota bacterium]